MHQIKQRRAARRDKRYAGQRHTTDTWKRRLAAKMEREMNMRLRKGRQRSTA